MQGSNGEGQGIWFVAVPLVVEGVASLGRAFGLHNQSAEPGDRSVFRSPEAISSNRIAFGRGSSESISSRNAGEKVSHLSSRYRWTLGAVQLALALRGLGVR